MSLDALMNNLLTLQRKTSVQGGTGGQQVPTFTTDTAAVEVPCSIQPASSSTQLRYMQRQLWISNSLYFDYNWNPSTGDRWVTTDGLRFFIVQGWYESLEIQDTWTCDVSEGKL